MMVRKEPRLVRSKDCLADGVYRHDRASVLDITRRCGPAGLRRTHGRVIEITLSVVEDGSSGIFVRRVEIGTGRMFEMVRLGRLATARDSTARWRGRKTFRGALHDLNSGFARALAISQAWLDGQLDCLTQASAGRRRCAVDTRPDSRQPGHADAGCGQCRRHHRRGFPGATRRRGQTPGCGPVRRRGCPLFDRHDRDRGRPSRRRDAERLRAGGARFAIHAPSLLQSGFGRLLPS